MTKQESKNRAGASERDPVVLVTPRRAALRGDRETAVCEVLVRVQAPDAPPGPRHERPPQALALVLDRSGSMAGRPIVEAQRCADFVVSRMRPTDVVALVTFDNRVRLDWPATPVGDGRALRAAIAAIEHGGSTNLHGGWLEGVHALNKIEGIEFRRVILLSDGCANVGVTDADEINARCARWAGRGVTTSTYGLGHRFNEELMVEMARQGAGNAYYGERGEDLMDPFEQELALLENLAMRDLVLEVTALEGIEVEMVNPLPRKGRGWRLPDLAWGAEAWAVLRVRVTKDALPEVGSTLELLRVKARARTLDDTPLSIGALRLSMPVVSRADWAKLEEDDLVVRRCVELEAGDLLNRVRRLASTGDWAGVDSLVAQAQAAFEGNDWVASILQTMLVVSASRSRARTMKEAMYSSAKLRSRLASKRESGSLEEGADDPSYLRRKSEQGKGR